jgi:hypothetical protein
MVGERYPGADPVLIVNSWLHRMQSRERRLFGTGDAGLLSPLFSSAPRIRHASRICRVSNG